jgi:hypothetical protein
LPVKRRAWNPIAVRGDVLLLQRKVDGGAFAGAVPAAILRKRRSGGARVPARRLLKSGRSLRRNGAQALPVNIGCSGGVGRDGPNKS